MDVLTMSSAFWWRYDLYARHTTGHADTAEAHMTILRRVLAAGVLIGAGLAAAAPAASAPAVKTTPSTWVSAAPFPVTISGVVVRGNRALVVWSRANTEAGPRGVIVLQRVGTQTRIVSRASLPSGGQLAVPPQVDSRGRWILLDRAASRTSWQVRRLSPNGSADRTFISSAHPGSADALTVDSAGRPVVLSARDTASGSPTVTRLTTAGAPDATFGAAGVASVGLSPEVIASAVQAPVGDPQSSASPTAVLAISGNRIVVTGSAGNPMTKQAGTIQRLTASGMADVSFGTAGTVIYAQQNAAFPVTPGQLVTTEPRFGSLFIVGQPRNDAQQSITWKRTADGRRDASFGTLGWMVAPTNEPLIQSATTCAGGLVQTTGQAIRVVTRSGRPDVRYGANGIIPVRITSPLRRITAAAADLSTCSSNYLAASPRARGTNGGLTLVWLSLPTR